MDFLASTDTEQEAALPALSSLWCCVISLFQDVGQVNGQTEMASGSQRRACMCICVTRFHSDDRTWTDPVELAHPGLERRSQDAGKILRRAGEAGYMLASRMIPRKPRNWSTRRAQDGGRARNRRFLNLGSVRASKPP